MINLLFRSSFLLKTRQEIQINSPVRSSWMPDHGNLFPIIGGGRSGRGRGRPLLVSLSSLLLLMMLWTLWPMSGLLAIHCLMMMRGRLFKILLGMISRWWDLRWWRWLHVTGINWEHGVVIKRMLLSQSHLNLIQSSLILKLVLTEGWIGQGMRSRSRQVCISQTPRNRCPHVCFGRNWMMELSIPVVDCEWHWKGRERGRCLGIPASTGTSITLTAVTGHRLLGNDSKSLKILKLILVVFYEKKIKGWKLTLDLLEMSCLIRD